MRQLSHPSWCRSVGGQKECQRVGTNVESVSVASTKDVDVSVAPIVVVGVVVVWTTGVLVSVTVVFVAMNDWQKLVACAALLDCNPLMTADSKAH